MPEVEIIFQWIIESLPEAATGRTPDSEAVLGSASYKLCAKAYAWGIPGPTSALRQILFQLGGWLGTLMNGWFKMLLGAIF